MILTIYFNYTTSLFLLEFYHFKSHFRFESTSLKIAISIYFLVNEQILKKIIFRKSPFWRLWQKLTLTSFWVHPRQIFSSFYGSGLFKRQNST